MDCKYCGKEMIVDDAERDRNGRNIAIYFICECGGACYLKKVKGFWKSHWTWEDIQ